MYISSINTCPLIGIYLQMGYSQKYSFTTRAWDIPSRVNPAPHISVRTDQTLSNSLNPYYSFTSSTCLVGTPIASVNIHRPLSSLDALPTCPWLRFCMFLQEVVAQLSIYVIYPECPSIDLSRDQPTSFILALSICSCKIQYLLATSSSIIEVFCYLSCRLLARCRLLHSSTFWVDRVDT